MDRASNVGRAVAVIVVTAAVALVIAGSTQADAQRAVRTGNSGVTEPAVRVISFDDTVGLLDSRTGALYRLEGNTGNASSRVEWRMRVAPVTGSHSGVLEIQRPSFREPGEVFLVDVIEGRTWILRRRASTNGSWDPIRMVD